MLEEGKSSVRVYFPYFESIFHFKRVEVACTSQQLLPLNSQPTPDHSQTPHPRPFCTCQFALSKPNTNKTDLTAKDLIVSLFKSITLDGPLSICMLC